MPATRMARRFQAHMEDMAGPHQIDIDVLVTKGHCSLGGNPYAQMNLNPYMSSASSYPTSDSEKMRDSFMQESRARAAEQREAALIEKLKIMEAELAARKPEGAHAVVPVVVHNKLLEAAEQRRLDADRKCVSQKFTPALHELITNTASFRVRDLETLILGLKAEV